MAVMGRKACGVRKRSFRTPSPKRSFGSDLNEKRRRPLGQRPKLFTRDLAEA